MPRPEDHSLLRTDRVEHSANVLHLSFERWPRPWSIRRSDAALVQEDQPRERGEPRSEVAEYREEVPREDHADHERNEISRAISDDVVRNRIPALRVPNFGRLHIASLSLGRRFGKCRRLAGADAVGPYPKEGRGLAFDRAHPRVSRIRPALGGGVHVGHVRRPSSSPGRGELLDVLALPGFIAQRDDRTIGLATYRLENDECEIAFIATLERHAGVGTALLNAFARFRGAIGSVTTNDNLEALRFYQRRGFVLSALRPGAVEEARKQLKPQISTVGEFGIPLRDEIELELRPGPRRRRGGSLSTRCCGRVGSGRLGTSARPFRLPRHSDDVSWYSAARDDRRERERSSGPAPHPFAATPARRRGQCWFRAPRCWKSIRRSARDHESPVGEEESGSADIKAVEKDENPAS